MHFLTQDRYSFMKSSTTVGLMVILAILFIFLLLRSAVTQGVALPQIPTAIDRNVVIGGDIAYIQSISIDLYIVDISDPLSPRQISIIPKPNDGYWYDLDATEDHLYLLYRNADFTSEAIYVYGMSDPSSPELLARVEVEAGDPRGKMDNIRATSDNQYLHIAYDGKAIGIFDIHDLANIHRISTYFNNCFTNSYHLTSQYAYVGVYPGCDAWQNDPIVIYDISNPANPILASDYKLELLTRNSKLGFDVGGMTLYVTIREDFEYYLRSIDVTDPTYPVFLREIKLEENGDWDITYLRSMVEDNGVLYIPAEHRLNDVLWSSMKLYDVRIPGEIEFVKEIVEKQLYVNLGDVKEGCIFRSDRSVYKPYLLHTVCLSEYQATSPTPTPTPTSTPSPSPTPTMTPVPPSPIWLPLVLTTP